MEVGADVYLVGQLLGVARGEQHVVEGEGLGLEFCFRDCELIGAVFSQRRLQPKIHRNSHAESLL